MVLFQPTGSFFFTRLLLLGIANSFDLTFLRFRFLLARKLLTGFECARQ